MDMPEARDIASELADLGLTKLAANRIAVLTVRAYVDGQPVASDSLEDLTADQRAAAAIIGFTLTGMSRRFGVANPDVGPAMNHAARAVRGAVEIAAS